MELGLTDRHLIFGHIPTARGQAPAAEASQDAQGARHGSRRRVDLSSWLGHQPVISVNHGFHATEPTVKQSTTLHLTFFMLLSYVIMCMAYIIQLAN